MTVNTGENESEQNHNGGTFGQDLTTDESHIATSIETTKSGDTVNTVNT